MRVSKHGREFITAHEGDYLCAGCGGSFTPKYRSQRSCSLSCKGLASRGRRVPLQVRVDQYTQKTDSCWLWTGLKTDLGYGRIRVDGQTVKAHRVSFQLANPDTPLTSADAILHSCDNPSCVNPDHLIKGTQLDNIADMRRKMRHAHGETSYAKLTAAQVLAIRNDERSQRVIAREHGIAQQTVSSIKRRLNWAHL